MRLCPLACHIKSKVMELLILWQNEALLVEGPKENISMY